MDNHPQASENTGYADAPNTAGQQRLPGSNPFQKFRNFLYQVLGAQGARESGLTALIYTSIANFAVDAILAVSLAGTLFFTASADQSRESVGLYLLITIAPFAILAPFIGPLVDRIQTGRRLAISLTFCVRAILAVILLTNYDSLLLYPAALGMLVMSKTYGVLKSAVTPRLVPPQLDLVRANSRLTILGHTLGTGVGGGIGALISFVYSPRQALWWLLIVAIAGMYASVLLPKQAEASSKEVPVSWRNSPKMQFPKDAKVSLWGTSMQRCGTGFFTIFVAFVAKSASHLSASQQLILLGGVGAAGAVGTFAGNATGSQIKISRPQITAIVLSIVSLVTVILIAIWPEVWTMALATLVVAFDSALSKVCLDATIQDELPPESRASAFGISETSLQLSWVLGGVLGILLPPELDVGVRVLAVVFALFVANTLLTYRGYGLDRLISKLITKVKGSR